MSKSAPRIPAVPREKWTDAMREVFAIIEGEDARINGSKFNAIHMFANHPDVAIPFLTFNKRLLRNSILSDRLRELVVLRVAWRHKSEYEWAQHIELGLRVGVGPEDVEAVKLGPEAPRWTRLESLALKAVDQLAETSNVDDETWAGLSEEFNTRELLELLFMIGTYAMVAWILNATRVEPDPTQAFPAPRNAP